jgi:hypothetical protein
MVRACRAALMMIVALTWRGRGAAQGVDFYGDPLPQAR